MLQRFYLIEGRADRLAPDPTSSTRGYLGQARIADAPEGADHVERFEPRRQVCTAAQAARAVAKGDVLLLATIVAASREAAEAQAAGAEKSKPKPAGKGA